MPRHSFSRRTTLFALAVVVAATVSGWLLRRAPVTPPSAVRDPRLALSTRYRNVRPEVRYVGDAACAECHPGQAETFRHHPMGRALAPIATATPIEHFATTSFNPFTASLLRYETRVGAGGTVHREWSDAAGVAVEAPIAFAIGSGTRARSYALNRDGYLFQSPLTWYPQAGRWDLSPGYELRNRHFERAITPGCLFCHANQIEHVPDTVNRYRPPIFHGHTIGCERCHGPGELHVNLHQGGGMVAVPDDTIVNPAKLGAELRDAVCHQCHVQGEQRVLARDRGDFDFRPGLPLDAFLVDFVDGGDRTADTKFVSSAEQLRASRCFRESREPKKLGCISCHDAHVFPAAAEKPAHYRSRCLGCHTAASCSAPIAKRQATHPLDNCIVCHMPARGSEVNHSAITDHGIPRRPAAPEAGPKNLRPMTRPQDLVPFGRDRVDLTDAESARNYGLAVLGMLDRGLPPELAREYARAALPHLEAASTRHPDDAPAQQARGDALWTLGRPAEALTAYESVLAARPGLESVLDRAGAVALELGRNDVARIHLTRLLGVNPWRSHYHHGLAVASFRRGDVERAANACNEALRLNLAASKTRSLLVQCLLTMGRTERAEREYEVLRELTAEDRREELRLWYEDLRRRLGR